MTVISELELCLFPCFLMFSSYACQYYSETCSNTFYQDNGLVHLPRPSIFRVPPALICRWTFTAKEGDSVSITFHDFSVEEFHGCGRGYVEILDGLTNTSRSILPKTCSPIKTPAHFKSSSNSVSVLFYSKYFNKNDSLLALVRTVSPTTAYKFHSDKKSWLDARDFCRKDNGDLASVYPVPSQELADRIENKQNITDAWVGQFVTPWVWLKGCTKWSHRHGIEPRYFKSKYNQKTECSMACRGSSMFLLQGGSCYCLAKHHHLHSNDTILAKECNISCPGNHVEKCGGHMAFTYYMYEYFQISIDNQAMHKDCVSESIKSFDARDCHSKFGFSCDFQNDSAVTYYFTDALPWNDARYFCEGLPGSIGLSQFPHWPRDHVRALWTSETRGQHWNYPQIYNKSHGPEEAYIASVDKYNQYELKLRNADHKYAFICEYQISTCGGNFTTTSGELQTPNFPKKYGHNQLCQWIVTVPESYRIRLEFSDFQLEEHELCLYDFVKIVDSVERLKDVRFCGRFIPRVFLSVGKKFTVIFKSDNSNSATGFRANWRVVDSSYQESESNASRTGLGGGAVAGIVLGTAVVVVCLFLIFFMIYRKRHKKHSSASSTVSNQIYGISSFSDESITEVGHYYTNVQGHRNPDVVAHCYTNPVRDELEDLDERRVFDYEKVCENRLEIDAAEYLESTGSQANLIASDGDDMTEAELYRVPQKCKKTDQNTDNITVESTLSLDDIENLGMNAITVVECPESKDISFDDAQTYAGTSSKDELPLDLNGAKSQNAHSQTVMNEDKKADLLDYEFPQNKTLSLYRNLEDEDSHVALTAAPSHTYEEMGIDNNFKQNQNMQHLLNPVPAVGHAPVSQVPSHAYAEIGDIDP